MYVYVMSMIIVDLFEWYFLSKVKEFLWCLRGGGRRFENTILYFVNASAAVPNNDLSKGTLWYLFEGGA